MELKYSEAHCELAVSTRHTSKLILVETLCILGVIVKIAANSRVEGLWVG